MEGGTHRFCVPILFQPQRVHLSERPFNDAPAALRPTETSLDSGPIIHSRQTRSASDGRVIRFASRTANSESRASRGLTIRESRLEFCVGFSSYRILSYWDELRF